MTPKMALGKKYSVPLLALKDIAAAAAPKATESKGASARGSLRPGGGAFPT